jgi:hypothetical protein
MYDLDWEVEKVVNATATAELEHPAYNSLIRLGVSSDSASEESTRSAQPI